MEKLIKYQIDGKEAEAPAGMNLNRDNPRPSLQTER